MLFLFLRDGQPLRKNLPLIAEDGPEAITQALVTIGVTASPLDLESVRTKTFSLHWLQSHLRVKYIHNKYNLIINELTALLIFLGSPFIWVFSILLPPGPPSTEENSNIYLTQPIQLAARLPRTRPVAASFSAANMLLSRLKRLFSYV